MTGSVVPWGVSKILDLGADEIVSARRGPINVVQADAPLEAGAPFSASRPQYVLPYTHTQLEQGGPLHEPPDTDAWAQRLGGVHAQGLWIEFLVTVNEPVVLVEDISVHVVRRGPALTGTYLAPNGAGDYFETILLVDLDASPPTVEQTSSSSEPWDYPLSLGEADTLAFAVGAGALDHDVEFEVHVSWTNSRTGESGLIRSDDDGRPYRLTGVANCDEYFTWDVSTGEARWGFTSDQD